MMRLYVLGSGSRGNAFAVEVDGEALLLDAGFSAREIERRAAAVGLELGRVTAIALTHEHGDHACGAPRLARQLGVPVLTAPGTWDRLARRMRGAVYRGIGCQATLELGPFRVGACPTSHDAAEPLALAVRTADGTGVGVAYDLGRPTAAVRYLLRNLTALVLEANYDEVALRTSGYPPVVQRRIAGSGGHLSNRAAADLLAELHHPGLAVVVLAHLSQRCNTADDARATIAPALRRAGFAGALHVAPQDEPLPPIDIVVSSGRQLRLAL
ncbi:MAG TPA: MBL fold metallo-hydrolase [Gemmatimonadales bacterium]|jgi:phosphoribosyl 1,2-cyclic phosphodiesterase|nr:MBL fold metallo-hydrolase [Gemmatimonadales bacterium]